MSPLFPPQSYRKTGNIHRIGLAANRPAATDVLSGTLYYSTDSGLMERSNGIIWEIYGTGPIADSRLSSNVALVNSKNYFSDDQFIQKPGASIRMIDTNGAPNQRLWMMGCDIAPDFYFQSRDDVGNITANAAIFRRNGDVNIGKDLYEKGRLSPMGHWVQYAMYWGGSGSNGSIGNGTLTGQQMLIGRTIFFKIYLIIGSTSVLPTGIWFFPTPVAVSSPSRAVLGSAFFGDTGVGDYVGWTVTYTANAVMGMTGANLYVTNTSPFTWGVNDVLSLTGSYEF